MVINPYFLRKYRNYPKEYEKCLSKCPRFLAESQTNCPKECEKIYDKYADLLLDRYVNNIEKLDSKVKDLPVFTTKKRKDRDTWFYRVFGY